MLLSSSAEMSRLQQFHMSLPQFPFNNSFHTTFFETMFLYVIRCIIKVFNDLGY